MTPAARVQAAIELIDAIIAAARDNGAAADTLIARYFAERRYAGSKDRRAVRDLVYAAIRPFGDPPPSGRTAMLALAAEDAALAALFDGSAHGPAPIADGEVAAVPSAAPAWLAKPLARAGLTAADIAALNDRAPLDIRVNRLKASPAQVIAAFADAAPIAGLPDALRLPAGSNVDRHPLALDGAIDIQDAGSQAVSLAAGAAPGNHIIDLCAGAGGKTLALAAAMGNRGAILACDVDRARLARLEPRAARAGVTIATTRLLDPGKEADALADMNGAADIVAIDAPCSGTGTWRRNPEARWRLTRQRLDRLAATQRHLMAVAVPLVRPGGAIVYIVCSLLDAEGADAVSGFLGAHPDWSADPGDLPIGHRHRDGWRLMPSRESTDGFFVATLRAPC